jgi:hypothetical protein
MQLRTGPSTVLRLRSGCSSGQALRQSFDCAQDAAQDMLCVSRTRDVLILFICVQSQRGSASHALHPSHTAWRMAIQTKCPWSSAMARGRADSADGARWTSTPQRSHHPHYPFEIAFAHRRARGETQPIPKQRLGQACNAPTALRASEGWRGDSRSRRADVQFTAA